MTPVPYTENLLTFLQQSATPFHCVNNVAEILIASGYQHIAEKQSWKNLKRGKYFTIRNDSSIIAFNLQQNVVSHGFRMAGAHTDSPCLKIKPNAISTNNGYAKLAVEVYGGALLNPWFDRDLALAGRITYRNSKGEIKNTLINKTEPIATIPSLAIHLDREVNEKRSINKQKHLPAILCVDIDQSTDFTALLSTWIKQQHGDLHIDKILAHELSLYDNQPPALIGLKNEFIASARLDNLLSCYAATQALVNNESTHNQLIVLNDHEEVGSTSTSGANGSLLRSALQRMCSDEEGLVRCIAKSMMISADNAHGVHPNYVDRHEPAHQPLINSGPVVKINGNQRYATNSETESLFKAVCLDNNIPYQVMVMRSDMGCGSTIGPITATKLGIRTVDVGIPQLAMHSVRELAGEQDQKHLVDALKGFFSFSAWPF